MSGTKITIAGPDGPFSAYAAGSGPAIVVLQEIFGVNHVMREICDDLAGQGWLAVCPDLFWRIEPGIEITDKTEAEWKQAFDLFGKFDIGTGLKDIAATVDYARRAGTGKVGAVGYCLGGQLAYLTACRTDCDASVGYYGVNIQNRLDEADKIARPLMLHIAEQDEFVPPEAQAQIKAGLKDHPHVTLHSYAGRDHAFARVGGAHYHAEDADLANTRTRAFFQTHLK
ncbi:dienelactone hydrolase family protein [Alkalicaulis satelles]|uniref:Dienelactone hydrolase family protein n=1 Tax=Alkalicaulis satelles TaxID=2609175 RepID=A0A5M6ZHR6_9PROT|nr:dienelactone hydrolase family protein [Alkalicaulis satelles]KAA5803840.1 dienelactone hydrolase family protein [Alkalicaulis satelles]